MYNATWNACDDRGKAVSSGVYFVRLLFDGALKGRQRFVLVK
jgi:hypothetical protein